jgi:hypothetical protein
MCPECGKLFTVSEVRSNRLRVPKPLPWGQIIASLPGGLFLYWGSQCFGMGLGSVIGMFLIGIGLSMIALPWIFAYLTD